MQRARVVRIVGLAVATVAAVAVFVLGGRDGGTDWQVPALVLIGVLVLVLQAATSQPRTAAAPVPGPSPTAAGPGTSLPPGAAGGVTSDPAGAVPSTTSFVPGLPQVQIPVSSFPDAGHAHGAVIPVTPDQPPPPLHQVLRPAGGEPSPPPPAGPPVDLPPPPPPPPPPH